MGHIPNEDEIVVVQNGDDGLNEGNDPRMKRKTCILGEM